MVYIAGQKYICGFLQVDHLFAACGAGRINIKLRAAGRAAVTNFRPRATPIKTQLKYIYSVYVYMYRVD